MLLLVSDFVLSFMWVCSGVMIKIFVNNYMGLNQELLRGIIMIAIFIANMFLFAFLRIITRGGAHNPLSVLASAVSGDFSKFLFCVAARIPSQVTRL